MHLLICSVAFVLGTANALPSFHGGHEPLDAVPGIESYHKLSYPKFDLIPLGSDSKDHVPPTIVQITKKERVEIPKPYKVEVKVPVPHPVHIPQPYPVIQTKIVKVPEPVHVEVIKKVPVPVEVPKPFPVPVESHGEYSQSAESSGQDYGYQPPEPQADFGGWNAIIPSGGSTPVEEHSQQSEAHQ